MIFTANEVYPKLWVGSAPPLGDYLARCGFDVVMLCAAEHQPPDGYFRDITVVHAPFRDVRALTNKELGIINVAANWTVKQLQNYKAVLVTCAAGINRSALIAGLAMKGLTAMSGQEVIAKIRKNRPGALTNGRFVALLQGRVPR